MDKFSCALGIDHYLGHSQDYQNTYSDHRIIDMCYTAFDIGYTTGRCNGDINNPNFKDWFSDTKPIMTERLDRIKNKLHKVLEYSLEINNKTSGVDCVMTAGTSDQAKRLIIGLGIPKYIEVYDVETFDYKDFFEWFFDYLHINHFKLPEVFMIYRFDCGKIPNEIFNNFRNNYEWMEKARR